MGQINELAKVAYSTAKDRGFFPSDVDIKTNLFEVVSEVAEVAKAHRDGEFVEYKIKMLNNIKPMYYRGKYEEHIKDKFESELAGAIIALLSIAEHQNVDIEQYIQHELMYNSIRAEQNI